MDPGGYVYVTLDRKPDPPSLVYPTSGVTFPRGTNITLDWNSSARATEYAVRLGGVSHPTITVSAGAATELNIGPVDPDAYSWQVQARNQYGATWSDIWNFTIRENIPAAPSILTVTAVSQTQINVTWRDNSNNEDGFYIYRYRDRETPAVIASVPANAVGYANVGLPCGTDYWYYVSAYNEAGENPSGSRRTATYPCTPELTLPTNGSTIDDSTPSFAWNQAGYFHEQYQIQVDDFPSFISPVISQTISTQGYTAASPLSDGTWYWRVRTYGWSNWSPWSSTWQFTISTAVSAQVEYVSRHIVQPGQVFSPTISVRVNSGYLDPVRGDDLRHTDGNTFGASTPQPIRYYVPSGSTYVFDTNNDPSFAMTAPSTEGLYTSIWRVWANGSYASGDAAIHLTVDGTPPDVRITSPTDGGALNANSIAIEVSASDARSGMNLIQFFLGYDDGTGWNWHVLGWDTDGSDGWSMTWNAITVTDQFVRYQVYGWDNAWNGTWHWVDSALDRTAPSSAVNPLNPTQSSTSFVVTWSGSDNLSGITSYDVQYRDGAGGIWTDWITGTTLTSAIFNGQHSRTYFFRSRALDRAGNQEPYPTGDGDTYTTINSPESVPYFYSVESGAGEWTATGFWHQVDVNSSPYPQARSLPRSWWYGRDATGNYDNGAANAGALTSPFVHIPTGGYYLRFWSWYETETHGGAWDTRRVQISANGGPFADVLQLAGDPMREWIPSPVIDLSPYAGSVIQFRLVFDTVDGLYNDYRGWYVDDFSITATPPMTCSNANEPNNWSGAATSIAYGGSIDAQICPQGDLDYYRFSGAADDRIVVDIDATVNGSLLDSYVFLLDSDGNAVLAQNDDEPTSLDSKLGYQLPHNGTYYVKVRAWAHPLVGGSDYFYTIRLLKDDTNPSVDFTSPADDAWLPSGPITVTVSAIDTGSGVRNVDFFWHSADWSGSDWIWLGSDLDGRDGWSITFDGGGLVEQRGAALFAWVCDWASNCAGDGAWNLGVDRTPPAASISVSPMYGDAPFRDFHVWWDGSDNLSGIARYDVQVRNGVSGAWLELLTDTPDTYYRFVGENGHTYYFRVRARDFAGNQSAYTTGDTQRTVEICPAAADAYERDNTYSSARSIEINSVWQTHNIHAQYDRDWARFTAFPGITYTIVTTNTGRHADTVVYLYEGDGTTLIASNDDDPENWPASRLQWQATTGGPYYIRVEHWDPYAYGCTTQYGLAVTASPSKPIHNVFLPVVMRNERAAQVVYSTDFEGTVGPEWSHTSTETTPVGARRFLGRFGNDTVNLTLAGLPSHTDVTVSFDLYLIDSWDGSGTDSSGNIVTTHGPDVWDLSVVGGPTLLHTTFSNLDEYDWWQAYPGAYPGANNPPLTGAAEVDTLGYTYYGNSVYRLRFTFPHSASSLELTFSASGLYGLFDESWGIDNVEVRVTE